MKIIEDRIKHWKASEVKPPTFDDLSNPTFQKGVLYGLELAMTDIREKNNKKLKLGAKKHYGFCWNCGVTHSFGKCKG